MSAAVYLIRHGQTARNKAGGLQGRSNLPLNQAGEEQAQAAGKGLLARGITFSAVYTSPLIRAVQTAKILAPGVPLTVDERLIEMDYGPYEGMDLSNLPQEVLTFFEDFEHNPAPAGMEQLPAVKARLAAFLEDLKAAVPQGNILISTHAIAMKGALEVLTPQSGGGYWAKYIGNCAVYRTDLQDGRFSVPAEVVL